MCGCGAKKCVVRTPNWAEERGINVCVCSKWRGNTTNLGNMMAALGIVGM